MLKTKANWDSLWSAGFQYGPIESWSTDIFLALANLLKDIPNPKILSAGCGRGLIDYWLIQVFGYHVTLLDSSAQCIKNLRYNLKSVDPQLYNLSHASIFDIPYPDQTFDLVWNEGVLEHFSSSEYSIAIKEMSRVSKRYVVIDVPNANCKPYVLAKTWLEQNNLWGYGYEKPRKSLISDFKRHGLHVLSERSIGTRGTIENYIKMVPDEHQAKIRNKLKPTDYKIFPHLLTIGEIFRPN
jgi:ubiquinone/menaquinone biosynthesis C-methylase UbiE